MIYYNTKNKKLENEKISKSLVFLYTSKLGRTILKVITKPVFSKISGFFINTGISKIHIKKFIKKNHIDMNRYEKIKYRSFNDFFTRRLTEQAYLKTSKIEDLISPCDAKLSVYRIKNNLMVNVKNSIYSIENLIQNEVPSAYQGGYCLVFRLSPDDYHRYHSIDNMIIKNTKKIEGLLHSVNPIVYKNYKVFTENSREVSLINTENFGEILWVEVGALNIGKINNNDKKNLQRYEEKGYFSFGGYTIILLFKQNAITLDKDILYYSSKNIETKVYYGDVIGKKTVIYNNQK